MHTILHSDMNSFYASVEILQNPEWEGKAVAVCGSRADRHGIVLAKSDPAKRAGVRTGQTVGAAQTCCPNLLLAPPHYELYEAYSQQAQEIYARFTDRVEPYGLDECWLDLGECSERAAWRASEEIRQTISRELGLQVSIGISYTKTYAKIGSDQAPRAGKFLIPLHLARPLLDPLPVQVLPGVGRATLARLQRSGVRTVGDLVRVGPTHCKNLLGKNGLTLWRRAVGCDGEAVLRLEDRPPLQSVGRGITCRKDIETIDQARGVLLWLAERVEKGLRASQQLAGGLALSYREADTLETTRHTLRLGIPCQRAAELFRIALRLYEHQAKQRGPARSLTLQAEPLVAKGVGEQLSLALDSPRASKLSQVVHQIRQRFGEAAIDFASIPANTHLPENRSTVATLPLSRHSIRPQLRIG